MPRAYAVYHNSALYTDFYGKHTGHDKFKHTSESIVTLGRITCQLTEPSIHLLKIYFK